MQEFASTRLNIENDLDEEVPENFNKSYYKLLDQTKVLKHICETGIGANRYLRAYHAVSNGANKPEIMEILGQ